MFKFVGMSDNKFRILDTDDNSIECVDYNYLHTCIVDNGIKIEGFSTKDNKVYDLFDCVTPDDFGKIAKNINLSKAKKAKNDEFYTQLSDIEKELSNYDQSVFKDKVIYCPCDVATTEGAILQCPFIRYFQERAHVLQFSKLISTCLVDKAENQAEKGDFLVENKYVLIRSEVSYATPDNKSKSISPVSEELIDNVLYYKYEDGHTEIVPNSVIREAVLAEDAKPLVNVSDAKNQLYRYTGGFSYCQPDKDYDSGDFRSTACLKCLKEADIVVTNPPFSLFKDFIKLLNESNKKFLILGSINEINFEYVFNLFKDNKCWRGYTIHNGHTKFLVPSWYATDGERSKFDNKGNKYSEVGVRWYTNIDVKVRHEDMLMWKDYSENEFPYYDDSDVIHIEKTSDIPKDYAGIMGVPVTFLDKFNPEQFELIGLATPNRFFGNIPCKTKIDGKNKYARLLIRNKSCLHEA